MDLLSATQKQEKTALLSLPRTDLIASSDMKESKSSKENEVRASPYASSELVLMQLPSGVKVSDLESGSYFVAPRGGKKESDSNQAQQSRQACLVMEGKKQSYSVSRLETSNVLVLVPPVESTSEQTAASTTTEKDGPAPKKTKIDAKMLPVPARLLKPGGSGASFLELRQKLLRPGDLAKLLKKHAFDPYNTNHYRKAVVGRSLSNLANQLQCSKGQVEDALKLLRSFPMPSNNTETVRHYGVLAEEALQEAQNAMISTLAECESFADYANKGVHVEDFIEQAMDRLPLDQKYAQQEHVLRHVITSLLKTESPEQDGQLPLLVDGKTERVQLDVQKIAVVLAHRLFQSQTNAWEESRFCVRWQSELPGVGKAYQTSLDMLRGVAIRAEPSSVSPHKQNDDDDNEEERYWKYFPADKLPFNGEERFQALFEVRDQWSSKDLEPYLDRLVKNTGLSLAEIMLHYTTASPSPKKGKDGLAVKLYSLKR